MSYIVRAGNLAATPELRTADSGAVFCYADVIVNDRERLDDGSYRDLGTIRYSLTVFRSAAALGIDAVLLSPRSADPLYRRAVRVSMGSVFQVPWVRLGSWPADLATVRDAGFTVAALALVPGAVALGTFPGREQERLALLLGTEGDGLSDAALAGADVALTIPMHGGVDSLNVAAAAAVAFWECRYEDAAAAVVDAVV